MSKIRRHKIAIASFKISFFGTIISALLIMLYFLYDNNNEILEALILSSITTFVSFVVFGVSMWYQEKINNKK